MGGLTGNQAPLSIVKDGSKAAVSSGNPLPVEANRADQTDLISKLDDVLTELKILNMYNALAHDEVITEDEL